MDLETYTPDEIALHAKNKQICSTVGNIIAKAYPARKWYVNVVGDGSVAWIACPDISMNHGIAIHLTDIVFELERRAKRAAGEILERFNLSRDKDNGKLDNLIVNLKGEHINAAKGEA